MNRTKSLGATLAYIDWEDRVTSQVEISLEADRSDAQAIVEGQAETMAKAWADNATPEAAAAMAIAAATGDTQAE